MERGDLFQQSFTLYAFETTARQPPYGGLYFQLRACDCSEERVVCTYVAALGRAVVKGLNILYLVGYFLGPKGGILLLHRQ